MVQILYSYMLTRNDLSIVEVKSKLDDSMDKAYQLYFALFKFMSDLTRIQELRLDAAKNKYLPTAEELNPDTRFIDNKFIEAIRGNEAYNYFLNNLSTADLETISWQDDVYARVILDKILNSDIYAEYMALANTDFATDTEFWRNVMINIVLEDEGFMEMIENKSVYWNDDLPTIGAFFIKTLKRWGEGQEQTFSPQFKDEQDAKFGFELLSYVDKNYNLYNSLIGRFVKTEAWDVERIALMDRVIMLTAIAEIINYPLIPVTVTMNEYIEIAKSYSSPRSGNYINGIMSSVVKHLRAEKVIKK